MGQTLRTFFDPGEEIEPEHPLPRRQPADIGRLIAAIRRKYKGRITGELVIPAREARHADFPEALDVRLRLALEKRGIGQLYSHQREAWDHIAAGRHTVVVTPTASGKTLCYNLPVLQAAVSERAKALYLYRHEDDEC